MLNFNGGQGVKTYRRNPTQRVLFITTSAVFFLMSIPYLTTQKYLLAMGQLFFGLMWLTIFLLSKRPYVILDKEKMDVYHNLIWPREYLLSNLVIEKELPKTIRFSINGSGFFLYKNDFAANDLERFREAIMEKVRKG